MFFSLLNMALYPFCQSRDLISRVMVRKMFGYAKTNPHISVTVTAQLIGAILIYRIIHLLSKSEISKL